MDKEQETLDMVLDIPNTISLNPFDRPPNIMDDELNSVTQEELEANLSTDCPTGEPDTAPAQNCNDMWEKLIQSFLEDNSTQDAVVQSVNTEPSMYETEGENMAKEETTVQPLKEDIQESLNVVLEEKQMEIEETSVEENIEPIQDKQMPEMSSNLFKNEPELDIPAETYNAMDTQLTDSNHEENSKEEEQMLSCLYDDAHNDLCQVEVYATDREDHVETQLKKEKDIVRDFYDNDEDDDSLSNVSAISIGYLEPIDDKQQCQMEITNEKDRLNETQLSTIINDHCYSQEVSANIDECDVLKQNVINHIMTQNISNKDHYKISKLVDKILNNLDNNKLNLMLSTLNDTELPNEEPAQGTNVKIENETGMEDLSNKSEDISTQIEKETEANENIEIEKEVVEEQAENIAENEVTTETALQEGEQMENIDKQAIQATTTKTTQQEIQESNEVANQDNEVPQATSEEQIETERDPPTTNETIEETPSNEVESEEAKSLNETLPYNCSEALEHQIFDEEFEMLCKNGVLPLKESIKKTDAHTQLLEKLKEFASQMQKDCEDFKHSAVENKLHDYIILQYQNFQELFKPYVAFKQSIETQTKSKKLTKRKRKLRATNSKNNLVKTSDQSSRYSSTNTSSSSSSSEEDDSDNIKTKSVDTEEEPTINKSDPPPLSSTANYFSSNATNNGQEYDDGINLSQYVQSEIFNIDSLSPQSTMLSDSDSAKDDNEDNDSSPIINKPETSHHDDDGDNDDDLSDSDDTMIYKVRSKKSKNSNDGSSVTSPNDAQKSNKSQADNMSVHSESDKENLTSERKERKSNESMDEDEKNDREIDRLTNISGLTKRAISNATSSKGSEKGKPKAPPAKTLNDRFDFMDVEFGSEDEVKSEAEEEVITEQQFLRNRNEDIKRQMLDESSTDSEALEEEDDELLNASSEEDEEGGGTKSPLVEKFLKTFKVDDSDNDIEDNDEDDEELDLDSDKEEEEKDKDKENKEENKDNEVLAEGDKPANNEDNANNGEQHTNAEMELLNDNFRIRNYTKPQNLDKMLLEAEKRKKISKIDAELISLSSDSSNSDVEAVDEEPSQKPRSLKPMLRPDQLAGETIKAQKLENERISRLEKKHNMLDKILKEHPEVDKNKELILDYIKDTKTFIKVHPGIVKNLKPHQFDGIRFMYDSCYGGVDALKKSPGSGCILAHCMGLGKTLQLISLLHTVISYKELKTTKILVLCPKSTVMNWADEIIRWLGPLRQKNVKVYTFSDTSDINEKLSIIKEWSLSNHARAGCLLIGYEAFRTLVFYHSYKNRGNINAERLEEIRLLVNKYLLTPGADLVVCDEGHIIKNSNSAISKAVAKIETPRRIVLTGTPIQNNLKEYYSMVNFIKPLFLGTEKEFANLYANPIKNGQHKDSGKMDIKIMKQRSFVLHKKLSKFVQRKEAELLKTFLPTKFEYVLFIPMTEVQNNLYQHILNAIKNRDENYRGKGLITDYTCLRKIWTHPKVLEDAWKNAISQRNKKETRNKLMGHNSDDDQPDDIYDSQTGQMSVTNDWWRHLVTENDLESVMPSNKLRTMFKILQMCEEKGEKCLIFSAFVAVLNVVEYFFKKISENDAQILNELKINRNSKWILGHDYYRLDGKTPKSIRHAMINEFNNVDNKTARVFLISAKAGGQGINLIGANRVIILDTSWNPSNDQQNIFRVFRLGQKRSCYIYRLLAMGTMEEKVYSRSVTKQAMSFRVVDEQQIDRHYNMAELAELYTLTIPDNNNRPTPILPQDSILARLLRTFPELVFKYHEHDSLLENKVEQELSEQEKNEAWTAYERDLQMNKEIREMPNIEDLQNKFNASNLSNYLSPFSGLDVSNNQNPSTSSKNMSHLLNYNRGFGQNFLQSLLGQNTTNAAALNTQQYIDAYNYYKNLGTYADMNPYTSLPGLNTGGGPGRMPNASTASSVSTNPLAALGDLSMFGLSTTALQTLGANAAALNLPSSLGNSSSAAALQQMSNSAAMYTSPSALNTNLPITSASNMATGGLASASNSAAVLSAFEQYKQSFRGTYNNMYNYTGDFGLSSSGSTILDSSKSKNSKQGGSSSSGSNNKNLPGGSKGGSAMGGLFAGPPPYIPSPQPQTSAQQQIAQQQRPNSRNTPTYEQAPPTPTQQQQQQQQKSKSTISSTNKSSSSSSASSSSLMSSSDTSSSSARAKSLLSYRRAESSPSASGAGNANSSTKQAGEHLSQNKQNTTLTQKKSTEDTGNNANNKTNTKTMKTSASLSNVLSSNQKSNQKPTTNLSSSTTGTSTTTTSASTTNTSNKSSASAQSDSNRAMNMGILYPNSKGVDKTSNKPNSPLNMGIVYPKSSSGKNSSEMQIIPTSSPPGTISISKQLNELSPSISLTALKTNTPNKTQPNQTIKTITTGNQNAQINKIMQSNSNLRRTTSPVNAATIAKVSNTNTAGTNATTTTNQSNLLARIKMANNSKKPVNGNSNNPVPPLHRASTMVSIPTTSTVNKSSTGLTITNVKNAIKTPPNMSTKSLTSTSQISTLAKQTAAAAVVKSNINRSNNTGGTSSSSSSNPNTANTSPTVPSLATFKRVIKRNSPTVSSAGNKLPPALASSPSLTVTSSNKLPIISSVKSISQYPQSNMATISKASITKINTPTNNSLQMAKTSTNNQPSVSNVSKTLAQMQKRLTPTNSQTAAATTTAATTSSNAAVNAIRNTVNIRPVDTKQNPAGTGGVYIIETNKLAIGAPTKSGGGTTVTKIPTQTAIKRKSTDPLSKDKTIETKRLKQ